MSCAHIIGEPDWKPHNVNVDSNVNAVVITEQKQTNQDINSNVSAATVSTDVASEVKASNNNQNTSPPSKNIPPNEKEQIETLCKDFQTLDPSTYEWTYYSDGSQHGKRCLFDCQFIGNKTTTDEVKLEHKLGTRFKTGDPRGGIPCVAPGDKNYSVPEFSSDFHAEGSTLPAVNFSRTGEAVADTFIPLQQLWSSPIATYTEKERERELNEEIEEVKELDRWSPAKPLTAGF